MTQLVAYSNSWVQVTGASVKDYPEQPINPPFLPPVIINQYVTVINSLQKLLALKITTAVAANNSNRKALTLRVYLYDPSINVAPANIFTNESIAHFSFTFDVFCSVGPAGAAFCSIDKNITPTFSNFSSNIALNYDTANQIITVTFTNPMFGEYKLQLCSTHTGGCGPSLPLAMFVKIYGRPLPAENLPIAENLLTLTSQIQVPETTKLFQTESVLQIPEISILSQTLIDGSDIGNTLFTIEDQFQYYDQTADHICGTFFLNPDQIKETIFDQCCPKIVTVLIDPPGPNPLCRTNEIGSTGNVNVFGSREKTAFDKMSNIYLRQFFPITLAEFILNITTYSMLRYILAKVLYGNFNINYLLNRYTSKFLHDLQNSRFCRFIPNFTDPDSALFGYEQYFLQ